MKDKALTLPGPDAHSPHRDAGLPWLVVGTIPEAAFPLILAPVEPVNPVDSPPRPGMEAPETLTLGTLAIPMNRGTPALLASMAVMAGCLGVARPLMALVAGDVGDGTGSRAVYERLVSIVSERAFAGITFHYLMPDVDWHNRILMAMESRAPAPVLVADAGFMYAAKMSGYAEKYDLFTPDIGELAFLADEKAPHPFYTRNFFLADESSAPELIGRAYEHGNAATHMLVKGKTDRYVRKGEVLYALAEPDVPALEPVGGTGDTVTGIVTACLAAGMPMEEACPLAMRLNRIMGERARPTPASPIADLVRHLPEAAKRCLIDL